MEKNILLINPRQSIPDWPTMPRAVEPMGLLYVAGAFRDLGIAVDLIDYQLGFGEPAKIYPQVARKKYAGAGIALADQACLWSALQIAQDLKNLCPDLPIFTGGVFATLNAEWILEVTPAIDFVVMGEAEPFVLEFMNHHGSWKNIGHVFHRENSKGKHFYPPVKISTSPEVDPLRSLTPLVIERGEPISVVASRGCNGGCSFCCISSYYGGKWQPRPISKISRELTKLIEQFDTRRFYLVDDNLFACSKISRVWLKEFFETVNCYQPSLSFKATCRLDNLDQSLIPEMKSAGFNLLKIGIETFSIKTQKVYQKRITREEASQKLDLLTKAGIGISLGFIMFDPYCELDDLWENLSFLLQYKNCWSRHLLRSKLIAYRGTAVEKHLERDSLVATRSIFGSNWTFISPAVAEVNRRFENLLRDQILESELKLYNYQQLYLNNATPPPHSKELEALLQDCWIDLFRISLENREITSPLNSKFKELKNAVQEYCRESFSNNNQGAWRDD